MNEGGADREMAGHDGGVHQRTVGVRSRGNRREIDERLDPLQKLEPRILDRRVQQLVQNVLRNRPAAPFRNQIVKYIQLIHLNRHKDRLRRIRP
jgi:hypothetical protein